MTDTTNTANLDELVNQIFEKTNLKVTQDDPAIKLYLALNSMLKEQTEQHREIVFNVVTGFINEIQNQLDGANEYYVNNTEINLSNIDDRFKSFLNSIDEKNKDLNFILNKIQANEDKKIEELFGKNFQKVIEEQQKTIQKIQSLHDDNLKRQRKIDTSRQHDIIVAGIGFIVGIIISLVVVFFIK